MGDLAKLDDALSAVIDRARTFAVSEEEFQAWETEEVTRQRKRLLDASGVSERLDSDGEKAIVANEMLDTRALQLTRGWLLSSRPALVLLSRPGGGKTVAAGWALARLPGRYYRARDLEELMLGTTVRERDAYRAARSCELLVIDELGSERGQGDAADMLQDIIDARQRLPRRTMLLSNLDPARLVARYDDRTLDRLGRGSDEHGIAILRSLPVEQSLRSRPVR